MDGIIWRKSSFCANGECTEVAFRRSSRCNGGACVEIGAHWRTASASAGGNCVEAAGPWAKSSLSFCNSNCVETTACTCGDVLVRDSKDPDGPRLSFGPQAWREFTAAIKAGELALR